LLYVYDMTPEVGGWNLRAPVWRDKIAAIAHASAYACLSQSTLNDLVSVYPKAAQRPCEVVLPGVEISFAPASDGEVAALADKLELPTNYYLFIGYRDAYKNADLLLAALPLLRDVNDLGVLLIGGAPSLEPGFAALAHGVPIRLADLSDSELRAAYTGAAALLYLSRYEGFGLPILEAMACDCPVITCRNSSLPEAAGDAAIYVDADDPRALHDAMLQVLESPLREELIGRGRQRAGMFRWARTAAVLGRALEAAVDGGKQKR
jgi:glycosyltransferase involved in cell wall biosynthesis